MSAIDANRIHVENHFTMDVPSHWKVDRNNTTGLCRIVCDEYEGSGLFIGAAQVDWTAENSPISLMNATKAFINRSILPNESRNVLDIDTRCRYDDTQHVATTLIVCESDYTWFVQLVFVVLKRTVYILHYNGAAHEVKEVSQIVHAFCAE